MSKKNNFNIAFIFDDLTEFFVMRPIIDELKKQNTPTDIIVPYDSGYNGLAEHTLQKIKELGYSPLNDTPKNKTYKILLTPYPNLPIIQRTNYIYHLQYPYGALSPKPNPTFLPSFRMGYDAIFSFNTYDQNFLDAYGLKVYPVPYWRYSNFKKTPNKNPKPVLLILPTFGTDTSCINDFTNASIKEIKQHFHIITKAHHAIHFGRDGVNALNKLKNMADEFYDSDTPIDHLLQKADIVLSDNSGAIFESICAGIPVALFAKNINSRRIGTMDTIQYTLTAQGILPHATKASQILPILLNIDSYTKKQHKIRNELFLKIPPNNPLKSFIDVINHFLGLDETKDYHKIIHDIIFQEWQDNQKTIKKQKLEIEQLNSKMQDYTELLDYKKSAEKVFNSKAYKLFDKTVQPYKKLKSLKRH